MSKKTLKKVVAVVLSVASLCYTGTLSYANTSKAVSVSDNGIAPAYIAISTTYTNLKKNSNGSLNCEGSTSVWSDNAGVVVELQKYDGGWTTIKTWSASAADYIAVDKDWYVENGYSYRVKSTHYAYDSNWNVVESVVKYSKTI